MESKPGGLVYLESTGCSRADPQSCSHWRQFGKGILESPDSEILSAKSFVFLMLPLCLELNFKNGIFLGRIFWSFLEMSHVKQDHQWAVGPGLSGASLGNGGGGGGDRVGKGTKTERVKAGCDKGAKTPVLETGPGLRIYSDGPGIMVGRREGRVPCQQGCGNAHGCRTPPPTCWHPAHGLHSSEKWVRP